ncbi:hypothetical protein F5J12DRAFT_939363 [Pisolithus orientalis]|uniref:uncharacterized protein n=1 Tax=Pisolithus orientalis TaxID=936130 RepID=UPI002224214E|nr:uncharacterized protein F5J12DRAFT_939363 [Pisolithus orientalis]KAI6006647.1 hypothetical protein F5J12DRAFT_939363 [Pisolithus orientalis]
MVDLVLLLGTLCLPANGLFPIHLLEVLKIHHPLVGQWLKVHAKKLADDLQIPDKSLLKFIETRDLFLMFVDMKASLVKYELSNQTHQLQALQDTLSSKDFELSLHNCLLACTLSPNLTAYVMDTQCHIMDFIVKHLDVFKIPAGVFDDVELWGSLGRIITKLLTTICSQLKSQFRDGSGRCPLEQNGIPGTSDHKVAALDICFTPHLIPNLKSDMCKKLKQELHINISDMEWTLFKDNANEDDTSKGNNNWEPLTKPSIDLDLRDPSLGLDNPVAINADTDDTPDLENPGSDANELDEMDSGFRLVSGKAAHFNSNKFWNYMDYMLNLLHKSVCKDAASKEDFETTISSVFVQIFQDDLVDCPGNRRGAKILAVNPQWQTTTQQGLMW